MSSGDLTEPSQYMTLSNAMDVENTPSEVIATGASHANFTIFVDPARIMGSTENTTLESSTALRYVIISNRVMDVERMKSEESDIDVRRVRISISVNGA